MLSAWSPRNLSGQRIDDEPPYATDFHGAIIPATAFDAKGSPRFACDVTAKRDGQLRQRLRGYCKGRHGTIVLHAK